MKNKLLIASLAIAFLTIANLVFGAIGSGGITPGTFWKISGVNLLPVTNTWQIGSSAVRVAKGWFTDLDVSGTFTLGGVVGTGGMDLNGEQLKLDPDGGMYLQAAVNDYLGIMGGNVGIGTTTPDYGLTVDGTTFLYGTTRLGGDIITGPNAITFTDNGTNPGAGVTWISADADAGSLYTNLPTGKAFRISYNDVSTYILSVTNMELNGASITGIATGTAASPGLSFNNDSNTGIFSLVPDTLSVSTGGTERLRVNASGNVGIGNTGPTSKLTVNGGDLAISSTGAATTTISSGVSTFAGGIISQASSTFANNIELNGNLTISSTTGSLYQPIWGSDDGLVLYLPFSEGMTSSSASIAYDRSPYGNDGIATNMPMNSRNATSGESGWATTTCKVPGCMSFDGSNDYVDIPQTASMSGWTAGTIEMWLNIKATPSAYLAAYADIRQVGTARVHLAFYGGSTAPRIAFINEGAASVSALSPDELSLNTWYYVVGTFDAATDKTMIYINGVLKQTDTTAFTNVITTAHDYINVGGRQGASTFNGSLDEVRVYNRALSVDEVRAHYLRGTNANGAVLADKFRVIGTDNNVDFQVVNGTTTITNGLIVDTNTLYVMADTGYVGIGTATPGNKLHIEQGGIKIVPSATAAAGIQIWNQPGTVSMFTITERGNIDAGSSVTITPGAGNNLNIALSDAGDFAVNTNQLYVDTSVGNVGIGTTTPSFIIDAIGDIQVYSSATTTIEIDSSSVTQGGCLKIKDTDGLGYTYCVANNGALTCSIIACK